MTRVDIPVEEQLEAYTSFSTREMFERHGIPTEHQGLFTADGRETRELFTFTWEQLVAFLRAHPERAHESLACSMRMRGILRQGHFGSGRRPLRSALAGSRSSSIRVPLQ